MSSPFEPPAPTPGGAPGREEAFSEPSAMALDPARAEQEMEALTAEFSADLLALKAEIERKLTASAGVLNAEGVSVQSLDNEHIVGVGLTMIDAEDLLAGRAGGGQPGEPGLVLYTVERLEPAQIQAELSAIAGTRALSALPVMQAPVGVVDALAHRFRMRPAPGGVSVGHFRITAGTLGCLVVGNQAPRNQRLMILSNNHVLANSNNAQLGDCICQPGPADGGGCPADQIAILERFVPIQFGGAANVVDCATGWAWPDRVRREEVYLSGGAPRFYRIGSTPIAPALGMIVGKSGRTTQLTQGRITGVGVTVNVNYNGRVAQFRDQIAVVGLSGPFSLGGDSGGVIVQWASGLRPVGLLFAGGGGTTFANRITRVLSDLDVRLYT